MAGTILFLAGAAALLADGDRAFRSRDYESATRLYERAFAEAEKENLAEVAAEAAAQAARGYLIRDRKEEGRPWLEKAKARANGELPKAWSRYLGVRGRFEWKDDRLDEATATFVAMYDYCEKHGLHDRAVDAAHMVAITGKPEQQVEWARKGIAAAEKGGLDGWLGPLWNNLGVTYQEKNDWKAALDCYRKARVYHWKTGGEVNKLAADWAVGMALRETGAIEESLQWLRPVLAWAERRHAEQPGAERGEWVGLACRELGYAELALSEKDGREARKADARKLLARAVEHLEAAGMPEWDAKAWARLVATLDRLKAAAGDSD